MIAFEDFKKMEIVVGRVVQAEDHPNADKLLVLKVEIGQETRQLVAGIKQHYPADELIGKRIVVIKNLAPATIRGVESNGMVLAARDAARLSLIVPEQDVATGSAIS